MRATRGEEGAQKRCETAKAEDQCVEAAIGFLLSIVVTHPPRLQRTVQRVLSCSGRKLAFKGEGG